MPPPWHEEKPHPFNRAYQWFRGRGLQSSSDTGDSSTTKNSTNITLNATDVGLDDESSQLNKKKFEAAYPDPFLTKEQIKYWGFIIYIIGKLSIISFYRSIGIMYAFVGISLATQNYINPAIDTIKKKGIVSAQVLII